MIYLIGGSGGPNFGDDLILSFWIRFYREKGYKGPIIVDCLNAKNSESLHSDIVDNVFFINNIKGLAKGRKGDISYYIDSGVDYVQSGFAEKLKSIFSALNIRNINEFLDCITCVHLYGGGYINGVWDNSFSLISAAVELKKKAKVPLFATGLGMAPLKKMSEKERADFCRLLDCFDIFELRDIESYNQVSELYGFDKKVFFGLDDSYLFGIDEILDKRKEPSIHVSGFEKSFSHLSDSDLLSLIESCLPSYKNIYFWMCNSSDRGLMLRLERISGKVKGLTNNRLINIGVPFNKNDYMITSRFHPHMLGARMGMSGVYLAGSGFYKAKHKSILDLGSSFQLMNQNFKPKLNHSHPHISLRENDFVKRKNSLANYILEKVAV